MQERWIEVAEFPQYLVSTEGRVMNGWNDRPKEPSRNQQGISVVNLYKDKQQNLRSVAVLVADAFLSRDGIPEHFDTPIHLNGDRGDCRVDNLAWRPRWFAIKYHQQFRPEVRTRRFGFHQPVEIIETGEVFETSWDAAIKYGMLDQEIFVATVNRTYVFPHHFTFRVLEE